MLTGQTIPDEEDDMEPLEEEFEDEDYDPEEALLDDGLGFGELDDEDLDDYADLLSIDPE